VTENQRTGIAEKRLQRRASSGGEVHYLSLRLGVQSGEEKDSSEMATEDVKKKGKLELDAGVGTV